MPSEQDQHPDRRPTGVRRLRSRVVVGLLVGLLAACSGQHGEEHNDVDVTFAQDMIPHHAQAVEMADLAIDKAADPRVRRLAEQVKGAQDPEIETMTGWLEAWDEDVPSSRTMSGDMGAMDGMMSEQQMTQLDTATGDRFDRLWVELMIAHHTGAVAAARTEVDRGQAADAVGLARQIETSQQSEIATMRTWQAGSPD